MSHRRLYNGILGIALTIAVLTVTLAVNSSAAFADEDFSSWLMGLKQEALAAGISDKTASATIDHIALLPNIIQLDHAQPEFISPFLDYYFKRVNAAKIAQGRHLLIEHAAALNEIEVQYGVPKSIIVAFWGMETNYGRDPSRIDTLSALATLAYDGRRAQFFRSQLLDAMRMIEAGNSHVGQLQGSWAGAFGHMQFMPSTFIRYAVDGDADKRIDIVNSVDDAFASAANYLSQVGWRSGEPAIIEVQLPENFQWQNAQLTLRKSVEEWANLGVTALQASQPTENVLLAQDVSHKHKHTGKKATKIRQNKVSHLQNIAHTSSKAATLNKVFFNTEPISVALSNAKLKHVSGQAAIILPQGWRGPALMVFDNFDAIMDWNRSVNYALSVAQLAQQLNQSPPILGGHLAENGALTFQKIFELQTALNNKGFDAGEPDGFPGLQTQAAIRAYQQSQQLPADGYASLSLFNALKATP